MGVVGCSSGPGRLSGNAARTWLGAGACLRAARARLERGGFRVACLGLGRGAFGRRAASRRLWLALAGSRVAGPALGQRDSRVTCLEVGAKRLPGTLPETRAKRLPGNPSRPGAGRLSGNPARRAAGSSPAAAAAGMAVVLAGPPGGCEAGGARSTPRSAAWAGWRDRELVFPNPGANWFFGNAGRAPERAGPGCAPKRGPRVCKKGAPRRGPAAGSRVTWPEKGETARWRPPSRAGAVFGRRCSGGWGGGPLGRRGVGLAFG